MAAHLTPAVLVYNRLMADSYRHFTGQPIVPDADVLENAQLADAMYQSQAAIVSHGTESDPIFCYANARALALWELDWPAFTRLPSRLSAQPDPMIQTDRDGLLREALKAGWVDHYGGIRISSMGKRFRIENTLLWNVIDAQGLRHGQAAFIRNWRYL